MTTTIGTLLGVAASFVAVVSWLYAFHYRFFVSIWKTDKVTAYGVYTGLGEAVQTHFKYLMAGLFRRDSNSQNEREKLQQEVEQAFRREFFYNVTNDGTTNSKEGNDNGNDNGNGNGNAVDTSTGNVIIAHSCRSIFYYMIRSLLNNAKQQAALNDENQKKEKKKDDKEVKIKICLGALQFGSFYRLLKGIEKSMESDNVKIEFYEIDFKSHDDWTLQQELVDEQQFKSCDLLLVQHVFGQPMNHDKLVRLAKKYDIPILEDCVQSGSLFSKYRGYTESDIIMYSGGLDKTPPCFGGGFAMFRNTPHGNEFYDYCSAIHNVLPTDTWSSRFVTCITIALHVMIAKNLFEINTLLGLVSYVWVTERGEYINWFAISLKVRKAKIITPFQHTESGFLRKPSVYQLRSMLYGLSKRSDLQLVAENERKGRDLLLSCIPPKYRLALFPFLTDESLELYKTNSGVSEFSWVVSPIGDRMHLCQHFNDQFLVSMVNTTWEISETTKASISRTANNNLIYLPNINEMTERQIKKVGRVLTMYCQDLEASGEHDFS
eukprot:CAMPEP_0113477068 /NCGR_PEP_ID=MMETSP0014_2-20120614/20010_1 /TAXON_ID=2857 /ORGANISM="Nitzschia sp." /LENGTH=547 /DNA_ID=CAMNT_0000370137 /DNA_START=56 /DNA_END=1699 /DNA_ORIENTATION=+ /assembly_acc=CAM_ASM_000159